MTVYDDTPKLHSVVAERIPHQSWVLAGIEMLPPGWVNVRLYDQDETTGRDRYTVEPCPGILHFESTVTEIVLQDADEAGALFDEHGEEYDEHPVIVDTRTADPPWRHSRHASPAWLPAWIGGGYIGTCLADLIPELLAEHGFADAIPLPAGGEHQ